MKYKYAIMEKKGDIGIIYMNRPERLHAIGGELISDVNKAADEAENDPEIRAAILTGTGNKAFSAGADLKETATHSVDGGVFKATESTPDFLAACPSIANMTKPVIAAVNGLCIGGSVGIALDCDIIICSENAVFQLPETNLGIIPGLACPQLIRRIGKSHTMEMVLTAEIMDAQKALRIGLVNEVLPLAELMPTAIKMAKSIAAKAPKAIALAKKAINRSFDLFLTDGIRETGKLYETLFDTDDRKEASQAFLEKREPKFTGK